MSLHMHTEGPMMIIEGSNQNVGLKPTTCLKDEYNKTCVKRQLKNRHNKGLNDKW